MSEPSPTLLIEQALPDYGKVLTYFQHQVGSKADAEDLTQETYSRLVEWLPKVVVQHPRGLLFRIARNLLVDRSRAQARSRDCCEPLTDERLEGTPSGTATPLQQLTARDDLRKVQGAIAELPERCREVFILNRFGGFSYFEIATRLDISTSTVEKHMIRALAACRDVLAPTIGE